MTCPRLAVRRVANHLPLLIDKPGGLLVEVTDGTADYDASHYRRHGATAIAITPGWLRSEMMLGNFGASEENWRDALDPRRAETDQPVPLPITPGGPSLLWHRIPTEPDGTRRRSAPVNSHANTGSPTSTVHSPTSGDTSRRSASVASTQTSTTIGKSPPDGPGTARPTRSRRTLRGLSLAAVGWGRTSETRR
jgi:hypothetical protein